MFLWVPVHLLVTIGAWWAFAVTETHWIYPVWLTGGLIYAALSLLFDLEEGGELLFGKSGDEDPTGGLITYWVFLVVLWPVWFTYDIRDKLKRKKA